MKRVLIFSDKKITAIGLSYSIFWEKFGYTVIDKVHTLDDAMKLIQSDRPELVFLALPQKSHDNHTMIEKIKAYQCKIVVVTDDLHQLNHGYLRSLGVIDIMTTSDFQPEDLIKRLHDYDNTVFFSHDQDHSSGKGIETELKDAARQQFLKELLYGWKKQAYWPPDLLEQYGIQFPYNQFIILVLKTKTINPSISMNDLAKKLSRRFINQYVNICENGLDELVFINNLDLSRHVNPDRVIEHFETQVKHLISNNFDLEFETYTSNAYIGISNITTGYMECFNAYQKTDPANEQARSNENIYIRTIKNYIANHYAEPINVKDLADQVNLTPSYFSTFFKEHNGETYKSYLIDYRLKKAMDLLTSTTLQIAEISRLVGYDNENYFSKLFKQKTGRSPSEFRKHPSS